MWRKALALLFLVALLVFGVPVDARKGPAKRRHVKAVARHLAKQLVKVQQQTTKHSAKISSTMSYSAAVGFCGQKIRAATAASPEGEGWVAASAIGLGRTVCGSLGSDAADSRLKSLSGSAAAAAAAHSVAICAKVCFAGPHCAAMARPPHCSRLPTCLLLLLLLPLLLTDQGLTCTSCGKWHPA